MKQSIPLALLFALALLAGTSFAADKQDNMKEMDIGSQKAMPGATHKAVGVVKEIDAKSGMVSFAHEPVKSLNWPAMTMDFAVKDKALLDKLAVGKKVEFEFVKADRGYRVTNVK